MSELTREEQITLATYERQAASWSAQHSNPRFWGQQLDRFSELLPSGRILEVGAGGGRDAKELIAAGYDYVGTDVSGKLLEQARKNNPGASFERASLYDLNYSEPFDGFWCSAVLLHIPLDRIDTALQAIHKNMKVGAIGFISVKEGDGAKLERDEKSTQEDERLFVYWDDAAFSQRLSANGYSVIEKDYLPMSERTKWLIYFVRVEPA